MQHLFSRKQYQKSYRNALNLEPHIQFDIERISRSRVIVHGVRFNLDKDILQRIQDAQQTSCNLYLSQKSLADLRYYALIEQENCLQPGLTFCTYYLRRDSQVALMRSVILTNGEIFHQIKSDCLERPAFCHKIASAHYWLIAQLLGQLRLRTFLKLNQLAWWLSWLIVVLMIIPFVPLLIQTSVWMLLALVLILWLLQRVLQSLLRWLLPRWVMRQLLPGLLSRKPLEKKIAKGILAWLEP